ncbi:hypothetical protein Tco_0511108 [Tanacetum coccineum]
MHRLRGGRSAAKIKDNDERQRISKAEGLIQDLLQKIFIEVNHKFRRGLLGIKLSELSTAKSKVSTAHKLQLPVLTNSALVRKSILLKKLQLLVNIKLMLIEKINADEKIMTQD